MESNIIKHAKTEFRAAGWMNEEGVFEDKFQGAICAHVLKLLEILSAENHSGTTAPYAIGMFEKLARLEPITPLTGEDWEWVEVAEGLFQNIRCSHLFKNASDGPYDIEGRVFWEWANSEDGSKFKSYFTSKDSRVPVSFPYTPTKEYVFRPTEDFPNE